MQHRDLGIVVLSWFFSGPYQSVDYECFEAPDIHVYCDCTSSISARPLESSAMSGPHPCLRFLGMDTTPCRMIRVRERERKRRERERERQEAPLALGTPRPPPYTGLCSCVGSSRLQMGASLASRPGKLRHERPTPLLASEVWGMGSWGGFHAIVGLQPCSDWSMGFWDWRLRGWAPRSVARTPVCVLLLL